MLLASIPELYGMFIAVVGAPADNMRSREKLVSVISGRLLK